MMANDKFIHDSIRCVYENADILVQYAFISYPGNAKKAVMVVAMLKDCKTIRMETGPIPLN